MSLYTFFILSALILVARASEPVAGGPTECVVKGVDGVYGYDPTSDHGPDAWGDIPDHHYETCKTGDIQSPIDFPTEVKYGRLADGPKPDIVAANMTWSAGNSNWALSCADDEGCGVTMFAGKAFKLVNTHFHSPSEHTLAGRQYPLEAHMVHQADDGSYAVIATMFDYPQDRDYRSTIYTRAHVDFNKSPLVKSILNSMKEGREKFPVYLGSVIDANKGYCVYVGSLTTPPCTEGVTFLMSMNVQPVTRRQVYAYKITAGVGIDGNNRPTQPLHKREITCYVK